MTAIFAIIKRLFESNKVSFIITAVVVLCATTSGDSKIALSNGNYTWLLAIITPFFFVFYDYTKLMHLGTSKKDYYIGTLASYGLIALVVSIVNTAIYVLIDPLNQTQTVINMMHLCGWTTNGVFIAFLQQSIFLLVTMIFLHVLLSMQPYWYLPVIKCCIVIGWTNCFETKNTLNFWRESIDEKNSCIIDMSCNRGLFKRLHK